MEPKVDVDQQIKTLRRLYRIGKSSLTRNPLRMDYGDSELRAKEARLPKEYLTKARVFASKEKGYTQAELDQLFALMQDHQHPVGVGHIFKLLAVPREHRRSIQKEAFLHHWSVAELKAQIRTRFGNRRKAAGRRPAIPAIPHGNESALFEVTQAWLRMYETLHAADKAGDIASWSKLTPSEQRVGDDARRLLEQLLQFLDNRFAKGRGRQASKLSPAIH